MVLFYHDLDPASVEVDIWWTSALLGRHSGPKLSQTLAAKHLLNSDHQVCMQLQVPGTWGWIGQGASFQQCTAPCGLDSWQQADCNFSSSDVKGIEMSIASLYKENLKRKPNTNHPPQPFFFSLPNPLGIHPSSYRCYLVASTLNVSAN